MSSISSHDENKYSHRQGSITSLPDEDDQTTAATDSSIAQQRQELSSQPRSSSSSSATFDQSNEYSKLPNLDDVQSEYQTVSDTNIDSNIQSWDQIVSEPAANEYRYENASQSDSTDDVKSSLGFQQQEQIENNYQLNRISPEELNPEIDYATIVQTKQLYYDPNPELIRKPQMISPIIYKQNIKIKFLKPPPVPQGPLIIREVRLPQPPPPPPLVIRQRPVPPLSPPPLILREKPPRVPVILTAKFLTRTLPPIPPPPRSVIIEKLPPLPPKPRDVIIERWIPYESTHKRKIIVQRAEEAKPYPPPKNIIITYDKIEARVVRQFVRLGVASEDPENYSLRYGNSLLNTKELLAQAKELGITEDLSAPHLVDNELQEQLSINPSEQLSSNIDEQNSLFQQKNFDSYTTNKAGYGVLDTDMYAPTYDNLINGSSSSMNFDELNIGEDLSTQLAQYGLTTESIPF